MATSVLCLHGKQDNCCTFDRLIPLLRPGFYFVCIDSPGHGRSSHYAAGFNITLETYVVALKRVVDHLGWKRFQCIGHSMGGMVASLFASVYPEHLAGLVMIDCAGPPPIHPQNTVAFLRSRCDQLLDIERKSVSRSPPSYTYEQAVDTVMTKRPSKLTRQAVDVLIGRSLQRRYDGCYSFTADQRMKINYNQMFSTLQQMAVVQGVKCPVLYLRAADNPLQKLAGNKLARKIYKANPNVRVVKVDGNHDVHLNHPERIAGLIGAFLVSENSKI